MTKAVKSMVKPVVYGNEMWPMSDTRKKKILRRIHGPVVEQVI
jgi:hypothetical protein